MSPSFRLLSTRRQFLNRVGLFGMASALPIGRWACNFARPVLASTESTPGASPVIRNRAPLAPSAFYLLPLGSVRPAGWLKDQLRIQANGLSGHLDETWADVGPNSGWLGGSGESWERGPYFLDGLVPLAYLLDDAILKAKAQRYVDWTLEHQAASGMIGPASNDDWWPRIVMLKTLTQYHDATGDTRVIPVMEKYFAYQLSALPSRRNVTSVKRPVANSAFSDWSMRSLSNASPGCTSR